MADIKSKYGTSNQPITMNFKSVANGSMWQSLAISNATDLFLDALVFFSVKSGAAGVSASGFANVFAYGSADGGVTFPDTVTGLDATITLTNPPNLPPIGRINIVGNATVYKRIMTVAQAFGGALPPVWGLVIENQSGAAFDAVVGSAWYQGIYAQAS